MPVSLKFAVCISSVSLLCDAVLLHILSVVYSVSLRDSMMSLPNLWGCGLFICGLYFWGFFVCFVCVCFVVVFLLFFSCNFV